jgi:hypothetical protein
VHYLKRNNKNKRGYVKVSERLLVDRDADTRGGKARKILRCLQRQREAKSTNVFSATRQNIDLVEGSGVSNHQSHTSILDGGFNSGILPVLGATRMVFLKWKVNRKHKYNFILVYVPAFLAGMYLNPLRN